MVEVTLTFNDEAIELMKGFAAKKVSACRNMLSK